MFLYVLSLSFNFLLPSVGSYRSYFLIKPYLFWFHLMLNISAAHMNGISGHCCKTVYSSVSFSLTKQPEHSPIWTPAAAAGWSDRKHTVHPHKLYNLVQYLSYSRVSMQSPSVLSLTSQRESRAPPPVLKPPGKDLLRCRLKPLLSWLSVQFSILSK